MTKQEARAVNTVLDFAFGTGWYPQRLLEACSLLAEHAHEKLGHGWTAEKVKERTRQEAGKR